MALCPCPECGWNVSNKADACPQCRYPLATDPTRFPAQDPGTLQRWEGANGAAFLFEVTGRAEGVVYGTDIYTSDSALAAVAVHAEVLKVGETGIVQVWIMPVLARYQGTSRNGVASRDWGDPWTGAYRVARWQPKDSR